MYWDLEFIQHFELNSSSGISIKREGEASVWGYIRRASSNNRFVIKRSPVK